MQEGGPTVSELISDEYFEQLRVMRDEVHRPRWGNGGQRHAPVILRLVGARESVLDYGCGLGMLLAELAKAAPKLELHGYDPGIPERAALPEPADLVVSTDVLEHIEPDKLEAVLQHIRSLTKRAAYLHIHTGPANAKLPDGRNAHLIQKPAQWWLEKLKKYYPKVEGITQISGDYRPTFLCEV